MIERVSWIHPSFHDYELLTDFGEKAELYQPICHFSLKILMPKYQMTIKIINNLVSNKARGPDIISIRMLK